jgi:hypothetical protein
MTDYCTDIPKYRTCVATMALPRMTQQERLRLARGLDQSHGAVLAELGVARAASPGAPNLVTLAAKAPADEEDPVAVADGDGEELSFDLDAALADFVGQMLESFPVPHESAEERIARAMRLRTAIESWTADGQPAAPTPSGLPMAASAYPGANLTQRTLHMVQASKAFAGKAFDAQYLEAVRLVRAGAVI